MKKLLLLSGLYFLTMSARAQTTTPQPSIDTTQTPSTAAVAKPVPIPQSGSVAIGELGSRRLLQRGKTTDLPEGTEGVAVVKICVDSTGNVTEAVLVPEKSTITNPVAVERILDAARQYRFMPDAGDLQCGNLTFKFQNK
ncbi:MAG: hypothetical protein IT262_11740 [Saprospiraceae bacterium]|nr:hypothetical protein [Saprospiraceae bacterium]